jgi:D-alanyl-D-alanine carboxypeptidase
VAVVLDAAGDLQRFEAARAALEYGFGDFDASPSSAAGTFTENCNSPFAGTSRLSSSPRRASRGSPDLA